MTGFASRVTAPSLAPDELRSLEPNQKVQGLGPYMETQKLFQVKVCVSLQFYICWAGGRELPFTRYLSCIT